MKAAMSDFKCHDVPELEGGKMKSNNSEKNILDTLNVSLEDKKLIKDIFISIQSENPVIKKTIPNLIMVAPDGAGTTTLGKEIAKVMEENYFFRTRGNDVYLELTLPKPDYSMDKDLLDKFFASPRIAAGTQNKFYGVFLIDLSAWDSKELMIYQPAVWKRVTNFVKDNKNNIYFCFRIKPDFAESEKLEKELKKFLPIRTIEVKALTPKQSVQYICESMKRDGVVLSSTAKEALQKALLESGMLEQDKFLGYHSLELLVRELEYRLITGWEEKKSTVSAKQIQQVMESILPKQETKSTRTSFGFC